MKDLKLIRDEPNSIWDLTTENYDLVLIDGMELTTQLLNIRLWFFFAEWYLDTSQGVRFFEDVMVKNPDLGAIEILLKETIMATENVNSILEFTMEYDNTLRKLSVQFSVDTTYGIINLSKDI